VRARALAAGGLAVLLTLILAGAGLAVLALRPVAPRSVQSRVFDVRRGEALPSIARRLQADGLVKSAVAVELLARIRGLATGLQAGEYELSPAMAPGEILERIASGRVLAHEIVIPEGFTAAQIAERLAGRGLADPDAFLAVARDPAVARELGVEGAGLEGYLFPETYHLPRGLAARAVADVLVGQFRAAWAELAPLAERRGVSMQFVVTLASIVEKETGAPEERPLIASVFLNRLARRMRLETDPTVIYGIPEFSGNLRRRDLEDTGNPYNTYVIAGLPPGPIANPGRAALRAVLEPADSDYLYFVSRNDGTHAFSSRYADHVRAVNQYQRRAAR
jgi:UPF0755 protein